MSTHNIHVCIHGEIRKILLLTEKKSALSGPMFLVLKCVCVCMYVCVCVCFQPKSTCRDTFFLISSR